MGVQPAEVANECPIVTYDLGEKGKLGGGFEWFLSSKNLRSQLNRTRKPSKSDLVCHGKVNCSLI